MTRGYYYLEKPLFKKVKKKTAEEQEVESIFCHIEAIDDSITKIIMDHLSDDDKDIIREEMLKSVESIITEAEELKVLLLQSKNSLE